MKNFNDIIEMYSDAEKEYLYSKDNFDNWLTDNNNILGKLMDLNNPTSILVGRKGTGKTRYTYHVDATGKSIFMDVKDIKFDLFHYITESEFSTNSIRFIDLWKVMIYFEIYKNTEKSINYFDYLFDKLGLDKNYDPKQNLSAIKSYDIQVDLKYIKGSRTTISGDELDVIGISEIVFFIERKLDLLKEKNKNAYLTIDGIDRILKFKIDESDVIGGLINALNEMNMKFKKENFDFKIICSLRDDIITKVNDPDLNKIISDCAVTLDWMSDKNSQLLELFNKRISLTSEQADLDTVWYQCFPPNVGNTSSFEHFISCTLYRPRDIVEFIMLAKNRYPTKSKLSITEFKDLVKTYSIEHFYPEMLNELSGFLDEEIISSLDNLFKRTLTGRDGTFKYAWFEENFNNLHGDTSESSKDVIEILFLRGYIGLSRHIKGKNRINFIHKDPRLSLNVDGSLVLHKGLYAAVNVLSY